ncbi:MAG TPA: glycosyltransferase [Chloroflexota bacterium]|nr:glycosyltransferase [Chloroflexota bacterium]
MVAATVPHADAKGDPRLGAVVLTHNRVDEVSRTLARLSALPGHPQIVVVDNASSDGTPAAIRARFPGVRYVRLAANRGAAARNVGVALCDRPYLALCDDDTWWAPGGLRRAADLLDAYPSLAVVTAKLLVGPSGRVDPVSELMAVSPVRWSTALPGAPLLGFLAGASVVRRAAFLRAGGFEPRLFLGGEEELLAIDLASAGWGLAYVDELVVHHFPSALRDRAGRRRLIARNGLWIAWLRRPYSRALAKTAALARAATSDPVARDGLLDALRDLPWALRHRRVAPPQVEAQLRRVEEQKGGRGGAGHSARRALAMLSREARSAG